MNIKKRLLIFYDWFYPGFRAGGPIQSLVNLTVALIPEFDVYVVTGARDLNLELPYQGIVVNEWNDVYILANDEAVKVFYAETKTLDKIRLAKLITENSPDIIYLNGLFSYRFFLLPLQAIKRASKNIRVVIAPRGMLKTGALSQKALKKKIYFRYLMLTGLLKQVYWHATSLDEAAEISDHFPANKGVLVAPNIPKPFRSSISFIDKKKGELKLVYLSLINEHKNLLLLLQLIKRLNAEVCLDIYGPVVDEVYWGDCQKLIQQMPLKVQYKGPVEPVKVQKVLSEYHALILLTRGENFGHAIYESLSVGRPVITSAFTPWQNLHENKAGSNVDIYDINNCLNKVAEFIDMEQDQYSLFCAGAHAVAANYYDKLNGNEKYRQLFLAM